MPLVGDFEWQETKDLIQINVPLHGVSPSKVDIFGEFMIHLKLTQLINVIRNMQ